MNYLHFLIISNDIHFCNMVEDVDGVCYKLHFLYILWYNKGLVANRRLHQMIICGRMYTAAGNEVTMAEYTGKDIVILEGLEAVRKRPGMYIGSTGSRGLHHLIWEILDNAIDEHLAGYCSEIHITLQKDGGICIQDNGRGVPVDLHPTKKIPTVRVVYTILHAGGKFGNSAYKVSGGLHGVGSSVVNALSTHMIVEVRHNGLIYRDEYADGGHPVSPLVNGELEIIGKCRKSDTGTKVTFYPDPEIFETITFKPDIIKKKLKEIAYLNKNLKLIYYNEAENEERT